MRRIIVWAAAVMALCASAAAEPGPLQLIDLTDDYDRIWTESQSRPSAERPAFFRAAFAKIIPGFYDPKRMERFGVTEEKYNAFLAKRLADYPNKRAEIQRVASQFQSQFAPALHSFEAEFGPMLGYPPIYLVHSHGEFDGGTRGLPEGTRLLFGADMIAEIYTDVSTRPFFHHELFHLLHDRSFPECEKVWCSLWSEGLAVHVAARLNPDAGDKALLLTFPVPLRPAVEANKAEAICAVVARLDSEKAEDYSPLFTGGSQPLSAHLPHRFGYYVGMLVAEDLGWTRSLKQLAALKAEELRPLIDASLRSMADCPRDPPATSERG